MYNGYRLGMRREEILNCLYGLFIDLMSCQAVVDGTSKLKKQKKKMSFEEAIELR